jgi:hypothetical protein
VKKPVQVLFARGEPESIEDLEKRLVAIDAMQRRLEGSHIDHGKLVSEEPVAANPRRGGKS